MAGKISGKNEVLAKKMLASGIPQQAIADKLDVTSGAITQWKQRLTPEEKEEILADAESMRTQFAKDAMDIVNMGNQVLRQEMQLRLSNPGSVKDMREVATSVKHIYDAGAAAAGANTQNINIGMDAGLQSIIEQLGQRNNIIATPDSYTIDADVQ